MRQQPIERVAWLHSMSYLNLLQAVPQEKRKTENFNCQQEPPNGIDKKQIKTIDYNYILSKGSVAVAFS
jgi:hypothetical protein